MKYSVNRCIDSGFLLRELTKFLQRRRNRISTDALNHIVQRGIARTGTMCPRTAFTLYGPRTSTLNYAFEVRATSLFR